MVGFCSDIAMSDINLCIDSPKLSSVNALSTSVQVMVYPFGEVYSKYDFAFKERRYAFILIIRTIRKINYMIHSSRL